MVAKPRNEMHANPLFEGLYGRELSFPLWRVRIMSKIQHDPRRSVVAGVVLATHPSVYAAVYKLLA